MTDRRRYEIVFDCRDRVTAERLCGQLEDAVEATPGDQGTAHRTEEGPGAWAVAIDFPTVALADEFFNGDLYRQFCADVRRACQASVLVVPLGIPDGSGS